MAYTKYVYTKTNWKNKSESMTTPVGKTNLNHMEDGIYSIAEELDLSHKEMDEKKFDEADANKVITDYGYNSETGILFFKFYDNTEFRIDFNVEKIPVSFSMNSAGVITMTTADGTKWTANIGDVIPTYTYTDSDTIAFSDTPNGSKGHTIAAQIRRSSITGEYMQPDYLSDIQSEASKAQTAATNAQTYAGQASDSADDADYDAKLARSYAIGGSGIRDGEDTDNAKYYKEQSAISASAAKTSENNASASATSASGSASSAAASATNAAASESNAGQSASSALTYATNSAGSATEAGLNATGASASAISASSYADNSESYAVGTNGRVRDGDATDNAKYYYEQTKYTVASLDGGLQPHGSKSFSELPVPVTTGIDKNIGWLFDITDDFVTDSRFVEGEGVRYNKGTEVYITADGQYSVMVGSQVTGIKGDKESAYRVGQVNITVDDIGAVSEEQYEKDMISGLDITKQYAGDGKSHSSAGSVTVTLDFGDLSGYDTMTIVSGTATAGNATTGGEVSIKLLGEVIKSGTGATTVTHTFDNYKVTLTEAQKADHTLVLASGGSGSGGASYTDIEVIFHSPGVQGQITDLKKSVSDGKSSVASAITGMGVATASDAAFATMADNIESITITSTVNGKTVTSTINGKNSVSKSVSSGTQGTPSLSWSGATLTASCTDTTGWIDGATKTKTTTISTLSNTSETDYYTPSTSVRTILSAGSRAYAPYGMKIDSLGGNATASQVLSGATFSSNAAGREKTGTFLSNKAAWYKTGADYGPFSCGTYPAWGNHATALATLVVVFTATNWNNMDKIDFTKMYDCAVIPAKSTGTFYGALGNIQVRRWTSGSSYQLGVFLGSASSPIGSSYTGVGFALY